MPHTTFTAWWDALATWVTGSSLLVAAYIGRLTYHSNEVRAGRRRFWSWHLALDIPTAAGMALAGWGISDYLALTQPVAHAVSGVLGYLGPRGVEVLGGWWLRQRGRPASKSAD